MKLEGKLKSTKSQWKSDIKQSHSEFQKSLESKTNEISELQESIKFKNEFYEKKLDDQRERQKLREKQLYSQIENEYSQMITTKDK